MSKVPQQMTPAKGFTLLEVMIAMVIFAVGMLGLAGIQGLSLESSSSSYSRTQAVLLASEMIDRIKANPEANNYVIGTAAAAAPSADCEDINTTCNSTEMADFDHWQWKTALDDSLLTGKGDITSTVVDTTTTYTVTVYWDEDRTGATSTTNCPPISATNDLRCLQLTLALTP